MFEALQKITNFHSTAPKPRWRRKSNMSPNSPSYVCVNGRFSMIFVFVFLIMHCEIPASFQTFQPKSVSQVKMYTKRMPICIINDISGQTDNNFHNVTPIFTLFLPFEFFTRDFSHSPQLTSKASTENFKLLQNYKNCNKTKRLENFIFWKVE